MADFHWGVLQVLSCGLGGDWSGKAPTCKYVDCGAPPNIDFGRYELRNGTTTVESIIEYFCEADYWLDGQKVQKCTKEGKWSSDAPFCERMFSTSGSMTNRWLTNRKICSNHMRRAGCSGRKLRGWGGFQCAFCHRVPLRSGPFVARRANSWVPKKRGMVWNHAQLRM